jgi:hypothetical protein
MSRMSEDIKPDARTDSKRRGGAALAMVWVAALGLAVLRPARP